jgi:hypothetical protein
VTEPGRSRTPGDVLEDHLRRAASGDTEGDIAANYSDDVVLLTGIGVLRGLDGVRQSRAVLAADLPGDFEHLTSLVVDEYAFIEWRGQAADVHVEDGADSFVIRDGRIVMQSIHYTVRHRTGYHRHIRHATSGDAAVAPVRTAEIALGEGSRPRRDDTARQ